VGRRGSGRGFYGGSGARGHGGHGGGGAGGTIERRTGDGVGGLGLGCVGVDVDGEAGVGVGVATGERAELSSGGCEGATAGDGDLSTLRVHLSGKRVKSDGLETDEVVARGNGLGDRRRPTRVLRDHQAITPEPIVNGAVDEARLVDLEPLGSRSIERRTIAVAVSQVGQHRAISMGPDLVPVGGDGCTSSHGARELESTGLSVVVASECGIGRVLDGVVGGPGTLDTGLAGGGIVWLPAPVPLATPRIREYTTVGEDGGGRSKGDKSGGGEHGCS